MKDFYSTIFINLSNKLNLKMFKLHALFLFISISTFSQDISENLLVEYLFQNNTNDSSINNYHAVNYGATFVDDRFGNPNSAIYFDGENDYIELPNLSELKPDFPISFSFWINYASDDPTDGDVFNTSFEEDRNTGVFFNSQITTGNYAINFGDGSYAYTPFTRRTYVVSRTIIVDKWYHLVIIVNSAADMKIYVDSIDYGGTYSGSGGDLQYSDLPGCIGRHDRDLGLSANYFNGKIDDFRYWDRELTTQEINWLFQEPLSTNEFDSIADVVVYPNPNQIGELNIKSNKVIDWIYIYDSLGKLVYSNRFQSKVNIQNFSKGVFFIKLMSGENVHTVKFINK